MKKLTSLLAGLLIMSAFIAFPIEANAKQNSEYRNRDNYQQYSQGWRSFFSNMKERLITPRVQAETKAKVSISGISSPTVLSIGQEGTWVVKASDSKNGALSYSVDWGETSPNARSMATDQPFVQTSTFTHTYEQAGTYTVKFTVQNEAGSKATSTVTVRVNESAVDDDPIISNTKTSAITAHGAKITWTTDSRANSSIWYGTESPLDTSGEAAVMHSGNVRNHSIVLKELTPNTTYYVVVGSENRNGAVKSSEFSFKTLPAPEDIPVIERLSIDTEIGIDETATLTVEAHDPKNRTLSYSVDWGDSAAALTARSQQDIFTQTSTFEHSYEAAGTYTIVVTVQNDIGQSTTKSIEITVS